ncbi:hypothetical protein [Peribacillus sp. NPDC056705]|uniref:hypothetical protein n=1 Tax=Peribacillus sp. NPDC056705 TaxID=3345918 RepID=UPI00374A05CE
MGKGNDKCSDNALCRALRRFVGAEVTIRTRTGDIITGELRRVSKYGLVEILEAELLSPFMAERVRFILVQDIESFSVELTSANDDD